MSLAHKFKDKKRTEDVLISETVDFSGLLLSKLVLQGLSAAGFQKPSPIQLKAIPLGRCGLDLIVQAKSGTGKTCVFTVVALESVELTALCVQVLVLAPTREIAQQIHEVVKTIGGGLSGLKSHTFIGGLPLSQDKLLAKSCHIAVGTPGRVKQLIDTGALKTNSIRLFVLDEADKLLEGDFQESINWIYSTLPENKQILALSATYPEYLAQHLTAYMRNPTFVRLNISDPALLGIKQYHVVVPNHPMPNIVFNLKTEAVIKILTSVSFQQCLIFSNMQMRAQNLQSELQSRNWPTVCIAGSLDQKERNFAMEQLKTYKCRILISTDLTSRGIDADKVNLVINLDVPTDHETYLHRIGRAGRFGSYGAAITIVSSGGQDKELWAIEKKCKTHIQKLPDPIPKDIVTKAVQLKLDDIVSSEQIVNKPDISLKSSEVTSLLVNTAKSPFLKDSTNESIEDTVYSNKMPYSVETSHTVPDAVTGDQINNTCLKPQHTKVDLKNQNKAELCNVNVSLNSNADSYTENNILALNADSTASVIAGPGVPEGINNLDGEKSADQSELPVLYASSGNIQCNDSMFLKSPSESVIGSIDSSPSALCCFMCHNEVCTCLIRKDEPAQEEIIGDLNNKSISKHSSVCIDLDDFNNGSTSREKKIVVHHSTNHSILVSGKKQNKIFLPEQDINFISAFSDCLSKDILSEAASEAKYKIVDSKPKGLENLSIDLENSSSINTEDNLANSPMENIDKCALESEHFGLSNSEALTIPKNHEDYASVSQNVFYTMKQGSSDVHTRGFIVERELVEASVLSAVSKAQDISILKSPPNTSSVKVSSLKKIKGCDEISEEKCNIPVFSDCLLDNLVSDVTSDISVNDCVTFISEDKKSVTNILTNDSSAACSDLIEVQSSEQKSEDLKICNLSSNYSDKNKFVSADKRPNDFVKPQQRRGAPRSFAVSDFLHCVNEGLGSFRTMDIGGGGDRKAIKNPNNYLPGKKIEHALKSIALVENDEFSQAQLVKDCKEKSCQFVPDMDSRQEISNKSTCCQSYTISKDNDDNVEAQRPDSTERKELEMLDQCNEENVPESDNSFLKSAKGELNFLLLGSVRGDNHAATFDELVRKHKAFSENFASKCCEVPEISDMRGLLEIQEFTETVDWQDVCDANNFKVEKIHLQINKKLLAVEIERKHNLNKNVSTCIDEKLDACQPDGLSETRTNVNQKDRQEKQLESRKGNEQTSKEKYKPAQCRGKQNESYEDDLHQYKNYRLGKQLGQGQRGNNKRPNQRKTKFNDEFHSVKTKMHQEQDDSLVTKQDRLKGVTAVNLVCNNSGNKLSNNKHGVSHKKSDVPNASSGDCNTNKKSHRKQSSEECMRLDDMHTSMLEKRKEQSVGHVTHDQKSNLPNDHNLTDGNLNKSSADRQVEFKYNDKPGHVSDLQQSETLPVVETNKMSRVFKDAECQELDNMHETMLRRRQERKKLLQDAKLASQCKTFCENPGTLVAVDQKVNSATLTVPSSNKPTVSLKEEKVIVSAALINLHGKNDCITNENSLKSKISSFQGDKISSKTKFSHMKQIELESLKEKSTCSKPMIKVKQKPGKPSKSKARLAGLEVSDGSTSTTTSNISLSSTSDISDVNLSDLEHETGAILQSQCYANRYADEVGHGLKNNSANFKKSVLSGSLLNSSYETANKLGGCQGSGSLSYNSPDEGYLKHCSFSIGKKNRHKFSYPAYTRHPTFNYHLDNAMSSPQNTEKSLPSINTDNCQNTMSFPQNTETCLPISISNTNYCDGISHEKISHDPKCSQSISKNVEYNKKKAVDDGNITKTKQPDSRAQEHKSKHCRENKRKTHTTEKRDILAQEASEGESEDECSSCHQHYPLFHPSYCNYGYGFIPSYPPYSQHLQGVPHQCFPYPLGYVMSPWPVMVHSPYSYHPPYQYNSFYLSQPFSVPTFPHPPTYSRSATLYHSYINHMTKVLCSMTRKFKSGEE